MTQPLITKYRPQSFADLLGQDAVVNSLVAKIQSNTCPHAFLFHGPPGTGKTSTARLVAQALGIDPKWGIDEINGAATRGIDQMRLILDNLGNVSLRGNAQRMIIIDECHQLTSDAWSALLKDTEEAPKHIYWAFCTTELSEVPTNIRTRLTDYELRKVDVDTLLELAIKILEQEQLQMAPEVVYFVAENSDGSPRDFIKNLDKCLHVQSVEEASRLISTATGGDLEFKDLVRVLRAEPPNARDFKTALNRATNFSGIKFRLKNYMGKVGQSSFPSKDVALILELIDQMPDVCTAADFQLFLYRVLYNRST